MKWNELYRIIDNILDVAESERDEDTKVEIIAEYLINDFGLEMEDK